MDQKKLASIYDLERERFLSEWRDFLRFRSISTDPQYNKDCIACAEWLCSHLNAIGLKATLLPTQSKPVVYATYEEDRKAPTALFYGHYDVQPVDPVGDWISDPFSPEVRNDRMYARGAQDNKGQVFYFIKAVETLIKEKALHCSLKFCIEGEEESGSGGLTAALPGWGDKLKSDVLMVCDTDTWKVGAGSITMGLRGIVRLTVKLSGLKRDLHSGSHGGLVKNPATEMARLVATLHNADGSIAVKDFYNSIGEIDPEDRKLAQSVPFDVAEYKEKIGVEPCGGERGLHPAERKGFRPTIEINGIHSGYGGPGSKTIIPAEALAKITARLVGKQKPSECLQLIINHIKQHAPQGLTLEITDTEGGGPPTLLSAKSPLIKKARAVLDSISEHKTAFLWEGGSIPVVTALTQVSGAEPLMVGFGLEGDNIHAPNESFALSQFRHGFMYAGMMLSELGVKPTP